MKLRIDVINPVKLSFDIEIKEADNWENVYLVYNFFRPGEADKLRDAHNLTPFQLQVIICSRLGMTNTQIAKITGSTTPTVRTIRSQLKNNKGINEY